MFREISVWHLVIILVAFVLLFGYKKLPDATRSLGRSMRIFKSEVKGLHDDEPRAVETRAVETPAENRQSQAVQSQAVQPQSVQPQAVQPQSQHAAAEARADADRT